MATKKPKPDPKKPSDDLAQINQKLNVILVAMKKNFPVSEELMAEIKTTQRLTRYIDRQVPDTR